MDLPGLRRTHLFPTLPFPPPAPLGRVTRLQRYYESATTTVTRLARSVALAARYQTSAQLFAPCGAGRPIRKAWLLLDRHSTRLLRTGSDSASQVPGEPQCAHAMTFDPAGSFTLSVATQRVASAFRRSDTVGSRRKGLSRLDNTACWLPVYASRHGSPLCRARLGSGGRQLCRVGLHSHWVPTKGFQHVTLHVSPFPRLSLALQSRSLHVGSKAFCKPSPANGGRLVTPSTPWG